MSTLPIVISAASLCVSATALVVSVRVRQSDRRRTHYEHAQRVTCRTEGAEVVVFNHNGDREATLTSVDVGDVFSDGEPHTLVPEGEWRHSITVTGGSHSVTIVYEIDGISWQRQDRLPPEYLG